MQTSNSYQHCLANFRFSLIADMPYRLFSTYQEYKPSILNAFNDHVSLSLNRG